MKKIIEYYISNIHHKGKRHIVRNILKFLPISHIKSFYGPIMISNPSDKTNVYAISGEYGNIISNHINSLPVDSIFIDIGTNYGIFSFLASKRLTSGKVISFEPNPHIYKYFLENYELNNPDNVIGFHCAVGEENGFMNLQSDKSHSGKSHLSINNEATNSGCQCYTIPVFNINKWEFLGSLLDNREINIKIDVEGYEYNIIRTLIKAPWFKLVKSIVVEIDSKNLASFNTNAKAIYKDLCELGFEPTYGMDNTKHYDEIFVR